ncbi:glycosyltransferase family 2 protein [Confluentibacter sediminis]|uniref:glycosyltransferase family 2 protein n=1 Tax=Confluentibacter sediminis TaxID=2219045 RepID=UPI000DAC3043|nr:glycosyltransferase family 2 protein [Confluentibacter sediminis]
MIELKTIAVLLTCHNRKDKTIMCLDALFKTSLPENHSLEVILVDDGSTDGTSKAVKKYFPKVHIITGNGNLYWNQGMRLAWKSAYNIKDYDFYVWLNDDTFIENDAITHLVSSYERFKKENLSEAIIVGSCKNNETSTRFSYGGHTDKGIVIPNGKLQNVKYMNGNFVLVSKTVFHILGNLNKDYTHGMGDYDYGLRALEENIHVIISEKYVATCAINKGIPTWCNPNKKLKQRWSHFNSPLGLNIKEYKIFRKRFWPKSYYKSIIKAYFKMLLPKIYYKLSLNK